MEKLKKSEILCEQNSDGNLVCSAIIEGVRLHRIYVGYTKEKAIKDFLENPPK
jgi:hypothetical protein